MMNNNKKKHEEEVLNEIGCTCHECGRKFCVDIIVPDETWDKIKPDGSKNGGGLLCPTCIMKKLEELNQFNYWYMSK